MAKHYVKDMATGRVTEVMPPTHGVKPDHPDVGKQMDMIHSLAGRLATANGFTRAEWDRARPSTVDRWRKRALEALQAEGHTFSPAVVMYCDPVR